MAREIRITIDDDEVFERMKARKRELDLSWEEVLHRGLRRDESAHERHHRAAGPDQDPEFGPSGGDRGPPGAGPHGPSHGRGERGPLGGDPDPDDSIGEVVDEFKEQIRGQVRDSLRASMQSVEAAGSELEREMNELEASEDAVLRFDDVTDDDPRYRVPLRVRLETRRGGLDFDVVAVRSGKSVSGMNRFDPETRRAVNEHLTRGGTATLSFGDREAYDVGPAVSWGRNEDGTTTVTDVGIPEVLFDDE